MDLSAIIVILVLSALALGGLVWLEMNSRKRRREEASGNEEKSGTGSSNPSGPVLKNGTNRA